LRRFFNNRNDEIYGKRDPDLRFNSIDGSAIEIFYSQVLLDPFKKRVRLANGIYKVEQ